MVCSSLTTDFFIDIWEIFVCSKYHISSHMPFNPASTNNECQGNLWNIQCKEYESLLHLFWWPVSYFVHSMFYLYIVGNVLVDYFDYKFMCLIFAVTSMIWRIFISI